MACCGVKNGAKDGMRVAKSGARDDTSDARIGVQDGTSDVKTGAQEQLPAQLQVRLLARPSNFTASPMLLMAPAAQPTRQQHARV
jgi:hypothetical protein